MIVLVAGVASEVSSWAEGCQCHEEALTGARTHATRHRTVQCCFQGRRGPELACGYWKARMEYLRAETVASVLRHTV
eukprot:13953856-Alexandrium_andersonii.AAC.1